MIRHPAVAGYFYQGSPEMLRRQIQDFILPNTSRKKVLGIMAPHAGLVYSGPVAGAVYSSIELPDTIVLIGPNHTGLGERVSIMTEGSWETPLGTCEIEESLAGSILSKSPIIREDSLAHLREHSLEVQLPFIQFFKEHVKIVPIQMLDTRFDTCLELGRAVAEAVEEYNKKFKSTGGALIVASSDMSHYERASDAKDKDMKAVHRILQLDPKGLYNTVKEYGISMCGYGPATVMLAACKILGATRAELIKYANSGDVSGDYKQVVGYAGVVIS